VPCPSCGRVEREPPLCSPGRDERLVAQHPGSGEDAAVVRTACPRTMVVDRARAVDQHRAVAILVITQDDVTGGSSRCREPQFQRNVVERVDLVRLDVDELRGCAARCAAVARHIHRRRVVSRRPHLLQPRREIDVRHPISPARKVRSARRDLEPSRPPSGTSLRRHHRPSTRPRRSPGPDPVPLWRAPSVATPR
jgi:hypothetical protein